MSPKDADEIANSVDPDQTSGFALFAQTYLSENLGSLLCMIINCKNYCLSSSN